MRSRTVGSWSMRFAARRGDWINKPTTWKTLSVTPMRIDCVPSAGASAGSHGVGYRRLGPAGNSPLA